MVSRFYLTRKKLLSTHGLQLQHIRPSPVKVSCDHRCTFGSGVRRGVDESFASWPRCRELGFTLALGLSEPPAAAYISWASVTPGIQTGPNLRQSCSVLCVASPSWSRPPPLPPPASPAVSVLIIFTNLYRVSVSCVRLLLVASYKKFIVISGCVFFSSTSS